MKPALARLSAAPRQRSPRRLAGAVLALTAMAASPAGAAVYRWDFDIDQSQVRNGPNPDGTTGSDATGTGSFVYDGESARLQYEITWNGLGSNLTKLHLHGPATAEQNEPNHLFEIYNASQDALDDGKDLVSDSVAGWIELDASATECTQEAGTVEVAAPGTLPCFLQELAYVNVHTTLFPMGEIRGNLRLVEEPGPVHRWRFDIDESQVRNAPTGDGSSDSAALGVGDFLYFVDSESLHYTITWNELESNLTKLHIHGPATPEQNEPNHLFEIYNASQDALDDGKDLVSDSVTGIVHLDSDVPTCSLEAGDTESAASTSLPCFLEERAYVNVHTTLFPMGEIRGNLRLLPEPGANALGLAALAAVAGLRRSRRAR